MRFSARAVSVPCSQKRWERFWVALLLEEQKPGMVFVQSSFMNLFICGYSPHPCSSPFGPAYGCSKSFPTILSPRGSSLPHKKITIFRSGLTYVI